MFRFVGTLDGNDLCRRLAFRLTPLVLQLPPNAFTATPGSAQMELFANGDKYQKAVHLLPKHLDEWVARLHLEAVGAKLTELTEKQAAYINVPVKGP